MTKSAKARYRRVSFFTSMFRPKSWPQWLRLAAKSLFPIALILWLMLLVPAYIMRSTRTIREDIADFLRGRPRRPRRRRPHPGLSYGRTYRSRVSAR